MPTDPCLKACPDVSSSSPDPASHRTKFYITLSGNKTAVSSTIISAESPPNPDRFQKRNMVGARSNVKSRLGSRKVLPYSRPEDERLSAKDRLGPVTHHSQLRLKSMANPRFAMDAESTYEDLDEQVDMVEIVEGELEADEPDQSEDDKIHMDSDINDVDQRFVSAGEEDSGVAMKSRLIDRINQRQLVVNLNETDEDDELSPTKGAGNKSVLQKPAIDTEQVHVPR
ncbi:hypothetical protein D915_010696 [Fasciola hepatica]|uniref:Uncharacterized protein n=1 Tax=Fasciola hepatica TaxID=6192 RepID=A0A4E0RVK4_FASHE|nr:hypothetical protein D915_010696 [Fasciola hepatica]